jgi:FSR family fosmidomycin resistance protein-like MFS transporter
VLRRRRAAGLVSLLLAIEFLDELFGGVRAAAWPLITRDLDLSYGEVGLVLAIPGLVGSALDPLIGVLGNTGRRRALLVGGGLVFALSAALTSVAVGFWTLLIALVIGNPATGAFVSLSQTTLMDLDPGRRERGMAWWTLAGSFGYVGGPLLLAAGVALGLGWRELSLVLGVAAVPLALAARSVPVPPTADGSLLQGLRGALSALRRGDVLRWLAALEASDLMLDVLHGFLALYLVDVAGTSIVEAGLGVAVWTGAGLVGDALLIVILRRFRGRACLRASALATLVAYPAFLLVPGLPAKLGLLAVLGLLNSVVRDSEGGAVLVASREGRHSHRARRNLGHRRLGDPGLPGRAGRHDRPGPDDVAAAARSGRAARARAEELVRSNGDVRDLRLQPAVGHVSKHRGRSRAPPGGRPT